MFKKIFSLFNKPQQRQDVGVNDIVTRQLTLEDKLSCSLVGDVTIIVDPQYKEPNLVMNICPGLLEQIEVNNYSVGLKESESLSINEINGKLIINNVQYPRPKFAVYTNNIEQLSLKGIAQYTVQYNQPNHSLDLRLNGVSDFRIDIKAKNVHLLPTGTGNTTGTIIAEKMNFKQEGVGEITLNGFVQEGNLKIKSVGDFDGRGLTIQNGILKVSGVGNATVTMDNIEEASLNSIGDVTVYTSTPHKLKQKGLGDLKTREMPSSGMSFN